MGLIEYRRKRHFDKTPEPSGQRRTGKSAQSKRQFIVQKHAASHLHYDFRLELDGVLKSWAVPKGPSLDPSVKSLAVQVEDHPVEYGGFEGVIPQGEYGGGTVMLWDHGTWESEGDANKNYRRGKLTFRLQGEKLRGRWVLVRMGGSAGEEGKNWLLKKLDDEYARDMSDYNVLEDMASSVTSGRSMEEIAGAADRVWGRRGEVSQHSTNGKRPGKRRRGTSAKRSQQKSSTSPSSPSIRTNGSAPIRSDTNVDASKLRGARRRTLPRSFRPQLATLVREAPNGDEWLHELKYDGYRILCKFGRGRPKLVTRHDNDWTNSFPTVAKAAHALKLTNTILDGEVVVLDPGGTSNFQSLQNHMQRGRDDDIVFFVFDLPFCDGYDLTACALSDRKELLKKLLSSLPPSGVIRFSDHILGHGGSILRRACQHALEGVVSKRIDSPYEQRRSRSWVKTKCLKRQEFVIGGWTKPAGSRQAFGALILGYYDDEGSLIYCGRVGTGFSGESLQRIKFELDRLKSTTCPFHDRPPGRDSHWVTPKLVAEVEFTQWTGDGLLRHPTFQGLREDKKPQEVKREVPIETPKSADRRTEEQNETDAKKDAVMASPKKIKRRTPARKRPATRPNDITFAGVQLSNPSRVLYPDAKITKRDLAEYYTAVGDWILPHLVHRPLTLVRCPQGLQAKCFYQKHVTDSIPSPVRGIEVEEKDGVGVYVAVDDLAGVITLVQLGCLEIHPWGSREDKIDFPDRVIFDLDPGEDVSWERMISAARDLRERFTDVGLETFLRTTGGKGLHLVMPIVRRTPWDEVKEFARSVAGSFARMAPEQFVDTMSKAKRRGKIYVDYLRNDRGSTAIASYSTRARAGATVATPIHWEELSMRLKPEQFTIKTVPKRLSTQATDPWKNYFDVQQSLSKAILKSVRAW